MSREVMTGLREQVRRIERPATTAHGVVPSGVAAIDRVLPGGGLARGAVHEILGTGGDEEDGALAAAFTAGILGRFAAKADGVVLWCLPRANLYGPGLAAHGLDPARLVLVRTRRDADILWAMEEGLRVPGLAAVVGEVGTLAAVGSRRLQLAAERSGIIAFLVRRWRNSGEAMRERNLPNAAATRWRIAALPSLAIPITAPVLAVRYSRENGNPEPAPGLNRGAIGTSLAALAPRWSLSSGRPLAGSVGGGDGYRVRGGCEAGPRIGHPRWRVELLRCRGGAPACWEVEVREREVADAANSLSLVAALADRAAAPIGADQSKELRRAG